MLDLRNVDLGELSMALEDSSPDHQWLFDPRVGELVLHSEYSETEEPPDSDELIYVEPLDSRKAYRDMEDFVSRVGEPRARDLLERAIAGRGAFRRFKDTLLEFPELRESWFRFHDARMRRRAIEWLSEHELVPRDDAERALVASPEPDLPPPTGVLDAREVARAVAEDLSDLYGNRLRRVVLFGSWARGDAQPESDVDLLVVLDEVRSRRRELARMSDVLWRHSLEHDTVVTEIPVSEREYLESDEPLLVRARAEGLTVT